MKLVKEFDFRKYLVDNLEGYDGKYSEYLLLLPALYDTLCSIIKSETLPLSIRSDVYLTIGYLFHPNDIYPEEKHGPLGFLEDLMLILVVLRKCAIQKNLGLEFIKKHSRGFDYPMEQLLTNDFDKIKKENNKLFDELLALTGMRFYYK